MFVTIFLVFINLKGCSCFAGQVIEAKDLRTCFVSEGTAQSYNRLTFKCLLFDVCTLSPRGSHLCWKRSK